LVRCALADVRQHGVGKRYSTQHSAGSGKSNSIAWLAHQFIADGKKIIITTIQTFPYAKGHW
jgi:type I restriction enzyme R subunit